jgi:hypothetical protein
MKKVLTALGMMVLGALAMAAENGAGGDGSVGKGLIGLGIGLAVALTGRFTSFFKGKPSPLAPPPQPRRN